MTEPSNETQKRSVTYRVDDHVALITLNRPDRLNAYTLPMLHELEEALSQAEGDDTVRALVLTGAGRAFCAGQSVRELADTLDTEDEEIDLLAHLERGIHPIIRRMRRMQKPIIGAINGVAAGAGASLAFACDLRVAADTAQFIQAFVNVGLIPDAGSTFFLPRLVGLGRALELAFTGTPIDAGSAEHIGLVNRVVPAAQLMEASIELACQLAQGPTAVIGLTKRAMNRSWLLNLDDALQYEGELQNIAGNAEEYREGIAAFMEKRRPNFTGT